MIIAIDGPAGSGKSSTARAVARRLGFRHLDSGAFYRALTWAALASGIAPEDWPNLNASQLEAFGIQARAGDEGFVLQMGGRQLGPELRTAEVTRHVSAMARLPEVRRWLLARLRETSRGVDLVADGRDMGTVVFPTAELKVFLVAAPDERARRRLVEQGVAQPDTDELTAERERLLERDRADSERPVAPLRKAADAVELDTTGLSIEEQVARVVRLALERRPGGGEA